MSTSTPPPRNSQAQTPQTRLTLRRPDEILGMTFDDSDSILGDRVMAKGQNACIVGPSGIGKSRLVLQIAVASILEREVVGLPTQHCGKPWLFLQAENSNRRLRYDLEHLRDWIGGGSAWAIVNDNLVLHTLEVDGDAYLFVNEPSNRVAISEVIQAVDPGVVVFDCLQNFAPGDLNKDEAMFAACCEISRLVKIGQPDRVPLVLHHALTGRAGAVKAIGLDRASFSRNSKALHAWTRGSINVAPGNEDCSVIVIACAKCSNGREFDPFGAKLDPVSMIYEVDPNFDLEEWAKEMTRKQKPQPAITEAEVANLCDPPGMNKGTLAKRIVDLIQCTRATAYRAIERAVKQHTIILEKTTGHYVKRPVI